MNERMNEKKIIRHRTPDVNKHSVEFLYGGESGARINQSKVNPAKKNDNNVSSKISILEGNLPMSAYNFRRSVVIGSDRNVHDFAYAPIDRPPAGPYTGPMRVGRTPSAHRIFRGGTGG